MVSEQPGSEERQPIPPDPGAARLQILTTEHWSLLSSRSLTYSESFSRVSMFLAVLTGAVVSLALLAQLDHFGQGFNVAAVLILGVVLFLGVTAMARLNALNIENLRWVMGMNRLRRAYLEMHPELEPYFVTGSYDDFKGMELTTAIATGGGRWSGTLNGLQTLPAIVGMIAAVVAAVLGALIAAAFGAPRVIVIATAAAVFLLMNVVLAVFSARAFFAFVKSMKPAFPTPQQ